MPKRSRRVDEEDEDESPGEGFTMRARKQANKGKGKGKEAAREIDLEESDDEGMGADDSYGFRAIGMKTEAEKLQLRNNLRYNQQRSREMNETHKTAKPSELLRILKKSNKLFAEVNEAADAGLDAVTLKINSDTATKLGKAMRATSNSFDLVGSFLGPLKILLEQHLPADADAEDDADGQAPRVRKNGALGDWEKVGWMAAKRTRKVMAGEFMCGLMAVEHKKRAIIRKGRQRGPVAGPEARPVELRQEDMNKGANDSMMIVKNMDALLEELTNAALEAETTINFFEWVINPDSFAQTVENLFYTSFLVRNGTAALEFDDEKGLPTIMAAEPPGKDDLKGGLVKKRQAVMEITEADWKRAVDLFDIKESMIPHRNYQAAEGVPPGQSQWY